VNAAAVNAAAVNAAVATGDDGLALASALVGSGLVSDPFAGGRLRFATRPVALPEADAEAVAAAAEAIAAAYHEAALIAAAAPALLDDFFALTPVQRLMWQASAPLWHGIARADVFITDGGGAAPVVCELNADTPSGQAEAVLLGPATGVPPARDPNAGLEARFAALLAHFLGAVDRPDPDAPPAVGIVYPTEIAGDFGLVRLYQRWCQARGMRVVLGSPYNLRPAPGGGVAMFGTRCDLVLRHYKTDWWSERLPIWADEDPYPDAEPLTAPLALLLDACARGCAAVVNPFGAVLAQNKRMMAFLWERRALLSPAGRAAVEAHLPETVRLEAADHRRLAAEQADWVLKSDYGCEGEEVILGAAVPPDEWRACLQLALPRRFVVQRHFRARRDATGAACNHGVYLVGGRRAGLYARLSTGATDAGALSAAVEVVP
jgi:hypothetical protein